VQKFWALVFGVVLLAALGLYVVAPFMGWWMPRNISPFGVGVDKLLYLILGFTGFFFVLCSIILVHNMWRFESQPGRKAVYVHGNHKLEVIWTIVPAAILIFIAVAQISVWGEAKEPQTREQETRAQKPGENKYDQVLEVSARQFEWRMRYPYPQ